MTPERPSFQVSLRPIRNIIDQLERPIAWDDRRPYLHPKYQVPADVSHNRYEDPDPTLGGMEARFVRRLDPNVTLPDGSDFLTWDDQTLYTMTLHVDQAHPGADDRNNGDRETPLRTIQAAARRATPRTRVVIHRGIYRERIIPAHGGTAPDAMICYQAADNEAVVVRGSMIYEGPWSTKTWIKSFGASETSPPTYRIVLPREWFVGCLPFGMPNEQLRIFYRNSWSYDESKLPEAFKDKIRMRRGLVFQDGQRLTQVRRMPDLLDSPGTYWCENDGRTIHIRPIGDLDPVGRQWEFTHLDQLFCPDERGLRFIRIKGITFEHAADEFPVQFKGAVSNAWGDHWIIEDCIVRQCNSVGINLGSEFWHSLDTPGRGFDIVRRCVIEDIGICGL
ncbi:MAG TPA: hypothetical protein PKB10_00145, partial [Tepidisphaeraceae bacterium]|nr:hypothetical protein [Tepidisphaeraceae bacterium]